jgi:hypothetical protein
MAEFLERVGKTLDIACAIIEKIKAHDWQVQMRTVEGAKSAIACFAPGIFYARRQQMATSSPIPIYSIPSRMVTASTSPTSINLHDQFRRPSTLENTFDVRQPKVLHPIDKDELRLLVLENISQEAVAAFTAQGFQVDRYPNAMGEDELVEKIKSYHGIGIRSKTRITERVIKAASKVWNVHPCNLIKC